MSWHPKRNSDQVLQDLTLAVIGCGEMGTAILSGILDGTSNARLFPHQKPPVSRFIACVQSEGSVVRLQSQLAPHLDRLEITRANNLSAIEQADVILLACKPYTAEALLGAEGVRAAMKSKLVISVLAGTTQAQLRDWIYGPSVPEEPEVCCIMRAMPNMAARIGKSITMISISTTPPPKAYADITAWIFKKVGDICYIADELFHAGAALAGATPAFMTVAFDGILDGAVAEGIKRDTAVQILAQSFIGAASLIQEGEHPAVLREKISSPGGTTIRGLLALEKEGVRSAYSDAFMSATNQGRNMS